MFHFVLQIFGNSRMHLDSHVAHIDAIIKLLSWVSTDTSMLVICCSSSGTTRGISGTYIVSLRYPHSHMVLSSVIVVVNCRKLVTLYGTSNPTEWKMLIQIALYVIMKMWEGTTLLKQVIVFVTCYYGSACANYQPCAIWNETLIVVLSIPM